MNQCYVYHVVTDRPMHLGQRIIFDETNHNGVYQRVKDQLAAVHDIYSNPSNYDAKTLEHHTRVALRELALEEVRKRSYPEYPSRLNCLYVSDCIEDAEKWAELFIDWGRPTYSIVKLRVRGNCFTGDANNCFYGDVKEAKNLLLAERYWKNLPNLQGKLPIKETLVDGHIEVIQIIKEINQQCQPVNR